MAVEIGDRRDADVVPAPARAVVDRPDNSTVREPGKGRNEMVFAWVESGEADARDGNEAITRVRSLAAVP
jgi:hypothetical protein